VTWATSVPILVFLGLSVIDLGPMYATDVRQTYVRQKHRLMPPPIRGGGVIKHKLKSAQRDANTARCLCRRGPSSTSVPNLKWIALSIQVIRGSQNFEIWSRDPGHAILEVVLYSIRTRGQSSISVPNLKRIAQYVQKLLRDPEIRKVGHMTPATPPIYGPFAGRLRPVCLYQI